MRYYSDDGKIFNTEEECLKHEKTIQERVDRYNAIAHKEKELVDMINQYNKDFHTNVKRSKELTDMLRALCI